MAIFSILHLNVPTLKFNKEPGNNRTGQEKGLGGASPAVHEFTHTPKWVTSLESRRAVADTCPS